MTDNITFGMRLRCERDRLALQQAELGTAGGVRRLDQHLYEMDARAPEMKYLKNVAAVGVDVVYLILGRRIAWADTKLIEMPTVHADELYRLIDEYATNKKGRLLPLDIRVWFHHLLVTSCGDAGSEITPGLWQDGMRKLATGLYGSERTSLDHEQIELATEYGLAVSRLPWLTRIHRRYSDVDVLEVARKSDDTSRIAAHLASSQIVGFGGE